MDELIAAGRAEQDVEKRKQLYAEAQQIISKQAGVLIPYFGLSCRQSVIPYRAIAPRIVYQNVWVTQG